MVVANIIDHFFPLSGTGKFSAGSQLEVSKLHYPNYITGADYVNRRITLIASTRPALHDLNTADGGAFSSKQAALIRKGVEAVSEGSEGLAGSYSPLKSQQKLTTEAAITLPLPNELSDSQSHEWKQESGAITDGLAEILKGVGDAVVGEGNTQQIFNGIATPLKYQAQRAGIRKPLLDPNYFQNYEGSTPRSFTLSFDFMPDNQEEAQMIKEIILKIKQYSSPSLSCGGVSLLSPYFWDLYLGNDSIMDLLRLDTLVCKSVNVTYGAEGQMQLFADGFPKYIKMSLSMQEATMTYADNYQNSYNSWMETRSMNNFDEASISKKIESALADVNSGGNKK